MLFIIRKTIGPHPIQLARFLHAVSGFINEGLENLEILDIWPVLGVN